MTSKRIRVGLGLVATAAAATLSLTGCSSSSTTTTADASSSSDADVDLTGQTLTIGVTDAVLAKLYEVSGLWDDAPYDIDVQVGTWAQQSTALNSGQWDIAFYSVSTALYQAGNDTTAWTADNAPVKLIGGWSPPQTGDYPWFGVAVDADSGIESIDDIAGKSIASSTSGDAFPTYLALLDKAGLTEADVQDYPFAASSDQVSAFLTGQASVYVSAFGSIAQQISDGDANVLITSRELGVPVLRGAAVLQTTLDDPVKHALIADWFVRYNELLTTWWDSHEEEVEATYESVSSVTADQAKYAWASVANSKARTFNDALLDGVQYEADLYYKAGAIQNEVSDVSVFFDDEFNQLIPTEDQPQP